MDDLAPEPSAVQTGAAAALTSPAGTRLLIGGKWVEGVLGGSISVENPFNGTKICDNRRRHRGGC